MEELGVYIHIPFCAKKCNYCDFLSFKKNNEEMYVRRLIEEIRSFDYTSYIVNSIFIGGGTPSILSTKLMDRIISEVYKNSLVDKDVEFTIELNPATFNREKLQDYKSFGINRLSIGLQSINDELLHKLGRIHSYKDFLEGYKLARDIGFSNINIDIMAGLPNQSLDMHIDTLKEIIRLKPEHISCYGLIIEEGTKFFDLYNENDGIIKNELPNEDVCFDMYEEGNKVLDKNGYKQYEISNYSLSGHECRHNIKYWKRLDYKGFGLGAASCLKNVRKLNTKVYVEYLKGSTIEVVEKLTSVDIDNEIIMLGLRMNEGFDINKLIKPLDCNIVNNLIKKGYIELSKNKIRLSDRSRFISNYIISELMR